MEETYEAEFNVLKESCDKANEKENAKEKSLQDQIKRNSELEELLAETKELLNSTELKLVSSCSNVNELMTEVIKRNTEIKSKTEEIKTLSDEIKSYQEKEDLLNENLEYYRD